MNLIKKHRAKRAESLVSRGNASRKKWEQSGDRRDLEQAIIAFSRAVPYLAKLQDGSLPYIFKSLGFCFGELNEFRHAKDAFEVAARMLPNDLEVWLNLASCNKVAGDDEGVRASFHQAFWLVDKRASTLESIIPFIRKIGYNDIADQWEARAQELRIREM